MWDTAREAERVCVPILPQVKQQTSLARSQSYKNIGTKYLRKLKHTLKETLPILNYQTVGKESEQADILYMWGAFPKNSKKTNQNS